MRIVAAVLVLVACSLRAPALGAEATTGEVRAALEAMHQWVDAGAHGAGWREYLQSAALEEQLAKGKAADPKVVGRILDLYSGGVDGLELPPPVRVRQALVRWLARLPGVAGGRLAGSARAAKPRFRPMTADDVARASSALEAAVEKLNARLTADGEGGREWRAYLRWDQMQAELARGPDADLTKLDAIYFQYASGHDGLELHWFSDVRLALRSFLTASRALKTGAGLEEGYGQLLDALAAHLESLPEVPSAEQTAGLTSAIAWLRDAQQAGGLIEQIRGSFAHPNLLVEVSDAVIRAGIEQPVDDTSPVVDLIMGTTIRGTGRTVGQVTAELIPNPQQAEVVVTLRGETRSDTIGYNGPARVYSDGVTRLTARKRIFLGIEGTEATPSRAEADTDSTVTGLCLVRGGRLVEKIAWKRVCQQKGEATQIASRHAEQRLNERLDDEVGRTVSEAGANLDRKFRQPLSERNWMPERLDTSTTAEALRIVALSAGPGQLAAPVEAPPLDDQLDLSLRIHESMVNNFALRALAGLILTEERLQTTIIHVAGKLPKQFQPDENAEPWAVHLAEGQPVFISFADDKLRLIFRGQSFTRGENTYPAMDVTADYAIEMTPGGPKAVRQGPLAIFPPGFDPAAGQRLSVRQQVIRDMLKRRFEKLLPPEIVPEPLVLPEPWGNVGELSLCRWETRDGWMVLGWKRP